jgi:hypothetical protein
VSSIGRTSYDSYCLILNKFNLIKILLGNTAQNNWTVVEMRLNKSEVKSFKGIKS